MWVPCLWHHTGVQTVSSSWPDRISNQKGQWVETLCWKHMCECCLPLTSQQYKQFILTRQNLQPKRLMRRNPTLKAYVWVSPASDITGVQTVSSSWPDRISNQKGQCVEILRWKHMCECCLPLTSQQYKQYILTWQNLQPKRSFKQSVHPDPTEFQTKKVNT